MVTPVYSIFLSFGMILLHGNLSSSISMNFEDLSLAIERPD